MSEARDICVIGLGNIGGGVARNLVAAGHTVRVVDLEPAKVARLVELGAIDGGDAKSAAAASTLVFTSVPGPPQLRAIGLGDDGLIAAMAPGSTWVELSTNDLDTARELRVACDARGVGLVDAPVSGGPEGAEAGTLSIFVGGDDDTVAAVRPVLDDVGTNVTHVGPAGAGIVAKIAQVTLCYTQTVTLIEAMLLGVKGGVDPAVMLDLIQNSAGRSYVADSYGPEILAGTYDASFPISHAAKDMRLAMALAGTVGADLPFMAEVEALYAETESTYGSTAAHLLAAQLLERRNGLVLHELPTDADATSATTTDPVTATDTEVTAP